jgi:hypothetical protein
MVSCGPVRSTVAAIRSACKTSPVPRVFDIGGIFGYTVAEILFRNKRGLVLRT